MSILKSEKEKAMAEVVQPRQPLANSGTGRMRYVMVLCANYAALMVGSVGSTLLAKLYFNHKGSSRWVSTWVQCAGFPSLLIPIYMPYVLGWTHRRPFSGGGWNRGLALASGGVGVLLGVNNLLYSWGTSYLPVSTSSLLMSTQLAFTLILSVLIVKQRITFMNLNCVVLLTLSSLLLALTSTHDRPNGLTRAHYFIGFFSTIAAGLLFALYLPVMEKIYRKVYCYSMVMEMQFMMEAAATTLATVGMGASGGFREMRTEGDRVFDLGPTSYALILVGNVVTWQLCFMGTAGVVFLTTSLTGGICMTTLMAVNVLAGVLVYGDNFGPPKMVSTLLCAWAFSSYVYGMYANMKHEEANEHKEGEKARINVIADDNHEVEINPQLP